MAADPAARGPTAVGRLAGHDVFEVLLLVFAPGHVVVGVLFVREGLAPAVLAEDVHGLAVVILQVLVVALAAAVGADRSAAVLQPLLRQLGVILPSAERASDRGGR